MKFVGKKGLVFITFLSALTLVSCGDNRFNDIKYDGKVTKLSFWIYGDENELEAYDKMTSEFNYTYGKEHNIQVLTSVKPVGSGYVQAIQYTASSSAGPDIFMTTENYFKQWVDMDIIYPITDELNAITDIDISDIPDIAISKYRYNKETNSSAKGEDQYGLPLETKPTALYYNETFFKKAGIIVISVDEEDIDKFNEGDFKDNRGYTKEDYGISSDITVPHKGYYRSENPYVSGYSWSAPSASETLIFNNRIACNWDEIEDLAMLFTPSYNANAKTTISSQLEYGYFTEWWFNYGWSVGGDCLADLSGTGEYNFSLLDPKPNYRVVSEDGYDGAFTGTHYEKGDTLDIKDKYECSVGHQIKPDDEGNYLDENGNSAQIRQQVLDDVEDGKLVELASTREAFCRYMRTGISKTSTVEGQNGLAISPNPATFNRVSSVNYFFSGKLAILAQSSAYIHSVSEQSTAYKFEWDVAPLAQYKEYEDPFDPDCDTVIAEGKQSGHSNSLALVTREMCKHKSEAAQFIAWMASRDGQKVKADLGFFPNQKDLLAEVKYPGYAPKNVACFGEALDYQKAGDWWYLRNYTWVDEWANSLNSNVRNDLMTYEQWKKNVVSPTNKELKDKYWLNK